MYDVIVIGAGVAGLTAAFRLKRGGLDVKVLEAADVPGGNIRTLERDGFRYETGPHSFMGSSEFTWKIAGEVGMEEEAEKASPASDARYILRDGKLHPLPLSPVAFLRTPLLSMKGKLRLGMEPFIRGGARERDTAWEFFVRRFGEEAATFMMSPFVSGVYAGDVKTLSARGAFFKFWCFEKDGGSMIRGAFKYMRAKRKRLAESGAKVRKGLHSFKGGLGRLTSRLASEMGEGFTALAPVDALEKTEGGVRVRSGERVWEARSAVLAVPPPQGSRILEASAPAAASILGKVAMAPVSVVHWTPGEKNGFPEGFGFLVPRIYGVRVLGTLFPSSLFAGRAPEGERLFASFYAGMTDPGAMDLDDGGLVELVRREHAELFHRDLSRLRPVAVMRYPTAIPQLAWDHPEQVESLREDLGRSLPGVFPAGNYLTGVGVEHAVESGFHASDAALDHLRSRGDGR